MPAPVITGSTAPHRFGSTPLPTLSASGATSAIQWSALYGSFSPAITINNQPTTYTPINQTDRVVITATDLVDSAASTFIASIRATFLPRPEWGGVPRKLTDSMEATFSEDGKPMFSERLPVIENCEFSFLNRDLNEWNTVEAFWRWHRTIRSFYLEDPHIDGLFHLMKFVRIEDEHIGEDWLNYKASFKSDSLG